MHIFIDETGTFTGVGQVSSPSLVGALIIPDTKTDEVRKRYEKIRAHLPKEKGEVKGRLLTASQAHKVVEMLRRNEVLFEAVLIDLGLHTNEGLSEHRRIQAEKLTANLTDEHHPNVHLGVQRLRDQLEAMPMQQYVQSVVNFELLTNVLRSSTLYYSQRQPKELAYFHWIIDAKEKQGGITKWEEWWSLCVQLMMQSKSIKNPAPMLAGADYSHFRRFFIEEELSPYMQEIMQISTDDTSRERVDLKMILKESFRFSADAEWGLELVDIVTNAVRRAIKGNLEHDGWKGIPGLMIHRTQQYISFVALHRHEIDLGSLPYRSVMQAFMRDGRSMLTRHSKQ